MPKNWGVARPKRAEISGRVLIEGAASLLPPGMVWGSVVKFPSRSIRVEPWLTMSYILSL